MAIEFCPLADEVGNLADWVAVGVGLAGAIGTIAVAFWANRTSKRATDIAEEAKGIARQQHTDYVAQRDGTARILANLLRVEIGALPSKLAMLIRDYDRARASFSASSIAGGATLVNAIREIRDQQLPAAESVFDQLHTLPNQLGADIAALIGMSRGLGDTASKIDGRFIRAPDLEGGEVVVGYRRGPEDFADFRLQLRSMLRAAIQLAEGFNKFSGVFGEDYASEKAVAEFDE